jgi:hypothetical protein
LALEVFTGEFFYTGGVIAGAPPAASLARASISDIITCLSYSRSGKVHKDEHIAVRVVVAVAVAVGVVVGVAVGVGVGC